MYLGTVTVFENGLPLPHRLAQRHRVSSVRIGEPDTLVPAHTDLGAAQTGLIRLTRLV